MSKDAHSMPETRSWREIPQQVRPRAMSGEGRRRVAMGAVRAVTGASVLVLVSWGAWEMAGVIRENPDAMPEAAKTDRVRSLVLVTDGVLDKNWLARTLSIPADATLMGLDLNQLRSRVLADPQVSSAAIVRNFPDKLTVRISERSPVARMMAQSGDDAPAMLLVSRDGVAFSGTGFDRAMVSTLPWIDGVRLARAGKSYGPVEGMAAVSDLLATAKLEAEELYRTWQVISLSRLESDGYIEVHTSGGMKVVFGTKGDYLRQIARLDLLVDSFTDPTRPIKEVNLALGSQVPVTFGTAAPFIGEPPVNTTSAKATQPLIEFPPLSNIHIDIKREL
jgi:POTRA domain-containing FtsQ-type protein